MRDERIYGAVLTCVTFCKDTPNPEATAQRFVERLAGQDGWTPDELEEIRRLVFERLLPSVGAGNGRYHGEASH
jgi:hypothetical protein